MGGKHKIRWTPTTEEKVREKNGERKGECEVHHISHLNAGQNHPEIPGAHTQGGGEGEGLAWTGGGGG